MLRLPARGRRGVLSLMQVPEAKQDPSYRTELLGHIQAKIDEHPRSHQAQIGPSEVGGCPTKVLWKMLYGGDGEREGGWAAHKGTVLHKWLDEGVFGPQPSHMPDGTQRWYSDMKLDPVVDHVNGGTLDLYDRLMLTVVDWKLPGDWTMKNVRAGLLSEGYYAQAMVYGMGLEDMGFEVRRTSLMFLPMCGDDLKGAAKGAIFRYWDYDRSVAKFYLDRALAIKKLGDKYGFQAGMEMLEKKSDFCSSCPAFMSNNDRRATCPGMTGKAQAPKSADPFA